MAPGSSKGLMARRILLLATISAWLYYSPKRGEGNLQVGAKAYQRRKIRLNFRMGQRRSDGRRLRGGNGGSEVGEKDEDFNQTSSDFLTQAQSMLSANRWERAIDLTLKGLKDDDIQHNPLVCGPVGKSFLHTILASCDRSIKWREAHAIICRMDRTSLTLTTGDVEHATRSFINGGAWSWALRMVMLLQDKGVPLNLGMSYLALKGCLKAGPTESRWASELFGNIFALTKSEIPPLGSSGGPIDHIEWQTMVECGISHLHKDNQYELARQLYVQAGCPTPLDTNIISSIIEILTHTGEWAKAISAYHSTGIPETLNALPREQVKVDILKAYHMLGDWQKGLEVLLDGEDVEDGGSVWERVVRCVSKWSIQTAVSTIQVLVDASKKAKLWSLALQFLPALRELRHGQTIVSALQRKNWPDLSQEIVGMAAEGWVGEGMSAGIVFDAIREGGQWRAALALLKVMERKNATAEKRLELCMATIEACQRSSTWQPALALLERLPERFLETTRRSSEISQESPKSAFLDALAMVLSACIKSGPPSSLEYPLRLAEPYIEGLEPTTSTLKEIFQHARMVSSIRSDSWPTSLELYRGLSGHIPSGLSGRVVVLADRLKAHTFVNEVALRSFTEGEEGLSKWSCHALSLGATSLANSGNWQGAISIIYRLCDLTANGTGPGLSPTDTALKATESCLLKRGQPGFWRKVLEKVSSALALRRLKIAQNTLHWQGSLEALNAMRMEGFLPHVKELNAALAGLLAAPVKESRSHALRLASDMRTNHIDLSIANQQKVQQLNDPSYSQAQKRLSPFQDDLTPRQTQRW